MDAAITACGRCYKVHSGRLQLMKRTWLFALFTAILVVGGYLARTDRASAAAAQAPVAAPPVAGQQATAVGVPAPQGAGRGAAGRGGFGGPLEVGPDDKPAFPDSAPALHRKGGST